MKLIAPGDTSGSIDKYSLVHSGPGGSREQDAHGRFLVDVHDPSAFLRTTERDLASSAGSLQIFVRRITRARSKRGCGFLMLHRVDERRGVEHQSSIPSGFWAVRPPQGSDSIHRSLVESCSGHSSHPPMRDIQKPARPCGLLYGIWTLVTSLSEPSGCVA